MNNATVYGIRDIYLRAVSPWEDTGVVIIRLVCKNGFQGKNEYMAPLKYSLIDRDAVPADSDESGDSSVDAVKLWIKMRISLLWRVGGMLARGLIYT